MLGAGECAAAAFAVEQTAVIEAFEPRAEEPAPMLRRRSDSSCMLTLQVKHVKGAGIRALMTTERAKQNVRVGLQNLVCVRGPVLWKR